MRQSQRTPKVVGLFLSPARTVPSDTRYLPISYRTVLKALEDVCQMPEVSEFRDLKVILRHYSRLIEGEFMEQPRAATIAWEIHRKYPRVISFLNENGPAEQIKNEIKVQLSETDGCLFEKEKGGELSFVLPHWREEPLLTGRELGKKRRIAIAAGTYSIMSYSTAWRFWFEGFDERLMLWLGADPGSEEAVDKLKAIAQSAPRLFPNAGIGHMVDGWPTVWSREFLSVSDLQQLDRNRIFTKLRERWQLFRDRSLPRFRHLLAISTRPR